MTDGQTRMSKISVTKLDAAKRQLQTAVELYFNNGDPISVHTLTWAGYQVICDLNKKQGSVPLLVNDGFLMIVEPKHRGELERRLRQAHTFFKHADHNPDAVMEFEPRQTEYILLDACDHCLLLEGGASQLLASFPIWFFISNRDYLAPERQSQIDNMNFEKKDKTMFYKNFMARPFTPFPFTV
jgi:hypothetical protein